jgi:hypothetical protein
MATRSMRSTGKVGSGIQQGMQRRWTDERVISVPVERCTEGKTREWAGEAESRKEGDGRTWTRNGITCSGSPKKKNVKNVRFTANYAK